VNKVKMHPCPPSFGCIRKIHKNGKVSRGLRTMREIGSGLLIGVVKGFIGLRLRNVN
jgi:hypothetical protein